MRHKKSVDFINMDNIDAPGELHPCIDDSNHFEKDS